MRAGSTATLVPTLALLGAAVGSPACGPAPRGADEVRVLAAASVAEAVEGFARSRSEASGAAVTVSAAASSTLARQIDGGAEADVFVSAHPEWIDWLAGRGRLVEGSRRVVAENRLAWVVPRSDADAPSLRLAPGIDPTSLFEGRLATGDPAHVPLGRYARRALSELGWLEALEPRVVAAVDARAALALVELGEVGAGIVYESDAVRSDAVRVLAVFPPALSGPIVYEAALVRGAGARAEALLRALAAPESATAFEAAGLRAPATAPSGGGASAGPGGAGAE